jgi:hypothetical protein
MDPITAFQVAASVISFVDFSRKLLSDAYKVYKSPEGQSLHKVKVSLIEQHLRNTRDQIEAAIRDVPLTASDHTILELCQQCQEIGTALQGTVQTLAAQGTSNLRYVPRLRRARKSFVVAAKGLWRAGQVEALNEQLGLISSQMMMAIMVSLWYVQPIPMLIVIQSTRRADSTCAGEIPR